MPRRGLSCSFATAVAVLLPVCVAVVAATAHAETPIPPPPARFVTDHAGFLSAAAVTELDGALEGYERRTGHQLLVYIDRTTGGAPVEDWAVRAFERWRVGRRGIDDGLVLFVFSDDRRVRVEVGYGLEGQLTDARAARIIDERVVPRIRAGDRDGAVRDAVAALTAAIGGAAERPGGASGPPLPGWAVVAGGLLLLLLLVLGATHPALAALLLFNIGSRGRGGGGGWGGGGGGGGGWGGGGFSGGGGRSGGGGASGSW
jgi:uncharacterized protein